MFEEKLTDAEILELQKETLETIGEYLGNLIPGMNNVIVELEGEQKEDTWEYLRMILDGFNWITEAYNGVTSLLNEKGFSYDNAVVEEAVGKLSKAFGSHDTVAIAAELKNVIVPFLEALKKAAE